MCTGGVCGSGESRCKPMSTSRTRRARTSGLRIPTVTNSDSREREAVGNIEACPVPPGLLPTSNISIHDLLACSISAPASHSSCDALLALGVFPSPDAHTSCIQLVRSAQARDRCLTRQRCAHSTRPHLLPPWIPIARDDIDPSPLRPPWPTTTRSRTNRPSSLCRRCARASRT